MSTDTHKELVQARFGPSAAAYAASTVHARGNSLARLIELARPQAHWRALDIATGAGHTALALAPQVAEVVASDLTPQMLDVAAQLARQRGLTNLRTQLADAEALPFEAASFDLVTCRIAAHHFANVPHFLAECARVLKPGGQMILVDNIAPEDAAPDVDTFERMRDPSHVHCLSPREWAQALVAAGFALLHGEAMSKPIVFNVWAANQKTPSVVSYELAGLLRQMSAPAQAFLAPVYNPDGSVALFTLSEGIYVARRGGAPNAAALQGFLGRWELDPAQSAYELGESHPMDNPAAVDAMTSTLIDDHLLTTAAYKAGRLLSYGMRELSDDQRALYINQIAFGTDGRWFNNRSVYARHG